MFINNIWIRLKLGQLNLKYLSNKMKLAGILVYDAFSQLKLSLIYVWSIIIYYKNLSIDK